MVALSSQQSATTVGTGVDPELTSRAIHALLKHHESSSSSASASSTFSSAGEKKVIPLLGNDVDIQVQFTLVRIPGNASPKPIRLDIPHPFVNVSSTSNDDDDDDDDDTNNDTDDTLRDVDACIIVKDASKSWVQEMITRFPKQLGCIKKVLSLTSLRIKHKTYEQRRLLLDKYDIFFTDDRILPMLSKAIGTKFFTKKKQPIPIKLCRTEALPFVVQKCLKSTYMYLSTGTCLTIKVGNTGMSHIKLLDNITAVCESAPMKVPRKWCNVRSISIKTVDSVALPVYNRTPEELEHIAQLAKVGSTSTPSSVSNEEDEEAKQKKKKVKSAMIVDTPLARALKKQKIVNTADAATDSNRTKKRKGTTDDENDESVIVVAKKASKSSNKKANTKSELFEEKEDKSVGTTTTSTKLSTKTKSMDTTTTTSSKKVKLNTNDESVVKSPKKKKVDTKAGGVKTTTNEDNNFVSATKFTGSKKGYVFTKGKLGLGYYKDVVPVVDKLWRANLGSSSRGGGSGGNNRMSMGGGQSMKRKKGGKRRSY